VKFKAIVALVTDDKTALVCDVGRRGGATGLTVLANARGEGIRPPKTFFGLDLKSNRDLVLFIVEEHLSRVILETIAREARFDEELGTGIAFVLDIEDVVGLTSQMATIREEIEDRI
jgi:nitrogen regulatory protein PII